MASTSRGKQLLKLALEKAERECSIAKGTLEASNSSGSDFVLNNDDSDYNPVCISELSNPELLTTPPTSPSIPVEEDRNSYVAECRPDTTNVNSKPSKLSRVRRTHNCLFCNTTVGNFARHLERIHQDETAVQEVLSLEKKSNKRKKLIDKLRKEGDFCTADIVPVQKAPIDETDYIVCKFCRGYYTRNSLRRHVKTCYFNPDPSKRFLAQSEGQTVMVGHFGPNDPLRTTGVLNMMRADDVAFAAKSDSIICEVGRRYVKKNKQNHLRVVAKRNMRRLGRLLISIRELEKNKKLKLRHVLTPGKFKIIVAATRKISEYDENTNTFKSPSLASQMGTLLKNAINVAYSLEVQKTEPCKEFMEQLKSLNTLIENDWVHEVSSEAAQNLNENRFNKATMIPVANDIQELDKYLKNTIEKTMSQMIVDPHDMQSFRKLQECVFCSVMLFNKRRVGELQRITLRCFLQNYQNSSSSEFEKVLSETEKILFKSLKRVVIRGKKGRGVPVLFDRRTVKSIEFLISIRKNFNLDENEYLFGVPGTKNSIGGYIVMRKHATLALKNSQRASLITSSRLRKHLATVLQIINMDRNELEQLATFMGHTEKTHLEFYRLPSDIYQTSKVSKLLLLAKKGSIDEFKGKTLNEINFDASLIEESESDDEQIEDNNQQENLESDDEQEEHLKKNDEQQSRENKIKKKDAKRSVVPWTTEQKNLTEKCFAKHIKKKISPKKHEIVKLMETHPGIFSNKSWQVIKAYVYNKYRTI